MATKLYYYAHKNPEGAGLPGVPLRDISEEEYADYPEWVQRSLDHENSFYFKTKPRLPKEESEPEGTAPKPTKPKAKAAPASTTAESDPGDEHHEGVVLVPGTDTVEPISADSSKVGGDQ